MTAQIIPNGTVIKFRLLFLKPDAPDICGFIQNSFHDGKEQRYQVAYESPLTGNANAKTWLRANEITSSL